MEIQYYDDDDKEISNINESCVSHWACTC